MSTANTTWVLNISENIIPKFKSMQTEGEKAGEKIAGAMNKADASLEKATKSGGRLGDCFTRIKAMDWYAVSNGIQSLSDKLTQATQPGVAFDTQMHELKALTGATDEQMQKMSETARKLSKEFGGSGADQLASYQTILSKLGPQIAEDNEALANMGKYTQTLSKTMQGDVAGATDALTNSLIQFKVNLNDPKESAAEMSRMMNVMAASAQEGSVEVPQISKALSDAGGTAKMFNLTFEETNAMLQGMAKGGVEIEKLGISARNVMLKMAAPSTLSKDAFAFLEKAGVDMKKVSDTSIPFTDRLKELSKVGNDLDALAAIFGNENVQGAQAMLNTIGYQEELTQKVTGTSTAFDMAAINMESWQERMKRYKAVIDDWKVSLFDATAPFIPFIQGGAAMLATGADMANIYSGLSPVFKSVGTWIRSTAMAQKLMSVWTGIVTVAQWAWNAAMTANPIGIVIVAIAALVAIVAVAIKHYNKWGAALLQFLGPIGMVINAFKSIKDHWESIKRSFQTEGIIGGLKRLGWVLLDSLMKPFQQILEIVDKVAGTDWAKTIRSVREAQNLVTDGEKQNAPKQSIRQGYNADRVNQFEKAKSLGWDGNGTEVDAYNFIKNQQKKNSSVSSISPDSILKGDKKSKGKTATGTTGKSNSETSISGNGGGVKNINMKIEIKNYFNVAKGYGNIENIANQVVGKINDRLRDGVVAMDF